jgi:iron complex outermembrane recepter protein
MTRNDSIARAVRRALLLSAVVATGAAGMPAFAQDQDQDSTQTVVVTGSRIVRQDFEANSPLTSVSASALINNNDLTLETALNNLPQIVAGGTTTSNNPPNNGQANIDLRGLGPNRNLVLINGRRPMVSANDLTVDVNTIPAALIRTIDVITGGGGAVYGADAVAGVVNIILKDDFQGFDLSAGYSNSTEYHDSEDWTVSALLGGNFADGRGNAVLAFDRTEREALIKGQRPFSVLATSTTGTPPQGVLRWTSANAIPLDAIQDLFATYNVAPDQVSANSGRLQFNRDGSLYYSGIFNSPLDVQNFRDPIDQGVNTKYFPDFYSYNFDAVNILTLPLDRTSLMSNFTFEVSEQAQFFGSIGWTEYSASTALAPTPVPSIPTLSPANCNSTQVCSPLVQDAFLLPTDGTGNPTVTGSVLIPVTNPFISDDLRFLLDRRTGDDKRIVGTGADEAFLFGIRPVSFGLRQEDYENTVTQYQGGVKGIISSEKNWGYEASFSEGRTEIDVTQNGNIQTQLLTDVFADPENAAGGACATWNPFGSNPTPEECIDALFVKTATSLEMKQQIAQAFVNGEVFDMPAGAASVVLGIEHRKFTYDFNPGTGAGPISGFNTQEAEGGENTFTDVFGEAFFPILRDAPGAQSLDVTLGYRQSKSQFEDTINDIKNEKQTDDAYKIDLSWGVVDALRLRGSYQRSVRAPNFGELFQAGGSFPQIFDPCSTTSAIRNGPNAALVRDLCIAQEVPGIDTFVATPGAQAFIDTAGNTDLKPEKGDTYTVGAVFTVPSESQWLQRFRASVDYYKIKVEDAILTPDPNVGIAACFNYFGTNPTYTLEGNPYCAGLLRSGDIAGIADINSEDGTFQNINGGLIDTSGVDLQVDYGFDLNWMGLPENSGALRFNFLLSHLLDYKLAETPGVPAIDYSGTINYFGGGISLGQTFPEWRAMLNTDWRFGDFGASIRGRYIHKMDNRASIQYIGEQSFTGVGSVTYWDLGLFWQFKENSEIRIGLNNVFDKQPPQYAPNIQSGTDPATYDVIGRRAFVRFNVKL